MSTNVKHLFMKIIKFVVVFILIVSNICLMFYVDNMVNPTIPYEYNDPVLCSIVCICMCELNSGIIYVLFAKIKSSMLVNSVLVLSLIIITAAISLCDIGEKVYSYLVIVLINEAFATVLGIRVNMK